MKADALRALPDDAQVPVRWVRELVAELGLGDGTPGSVGLTVPQVADLTDRSPSTIRTWCAEGRLPGACRLRGREWRIPRRALDALVAGEGRPSPPRPGGPMKTPPGGLSAWRAEVAESNGSRRR